MEVVYPGTFDPFTNGHLDVVRRGVRIFGALTVAVAEGGKKKTLFPLAERVALIRQSVAGIGNVRVTDFSGTLVDFLDRSGVRTVLRGLRTLSDCDYEMQMALFNRQLDPRVETVFVAASPEHAAICSGLVREVAALGRDASAFVPPPVGAALRRMFRRRSGR